jgi:hypothetical protein
MNPANNQRSLDDIVVTMTRCVLLCVDLRIRAAFNAITSDDN